MKDFPIKKKRTQFPPGNLPAMPKAAHGHMQPAKENGGHVTSIASPSCYYRFISFWEAWPIFRCLKAS